jgi:Ion transport protein
LLSLGANPDKTRLKSYQKWSTFEKICKDQRGSYYIRKCLEYNADPNKVSSSEESVCIINSFQYRSIFCKENDGRYPIHHAVEVLAVENIQILLNADADCANQTLEFDKTPLHLLTGVLKEENLPKVFEIIKIFSKFGGNFSWPARKSDNETPFSMLLEKLATLKDKETCLQIIRYLIAKYPRIDEFQRKKCAGFIRQHFKELIGEYQVIESWKDEIISFENLNSRSQLIKMIKQNEAKFLIKFIDLEKTKIEVNTLELFAKNAVAMDRFEIFAEIFKNFEMDREFENELMVTHILKYNRHRILKFCLNRVEWINPTWIEYTIKNMELYETDIERNAEKCFRILLSHPKYDVNQVYDNTTALRFAATTSEFATLELLKKGASLSQLDDNRHMAIQAIKSSTLKQFFDACITKHIPYERSDFYLMEIDYSFLKAPEEMSLIKYMTEAKDVQPLIEHPVISSFLFLKWFRLSDIFYWNLLFYSLNAITFTAYLLVYTNLDHRDYGVGHLLLAYVSFIIFSGKEISQYIGSPTNYLHSYENYFEMLLTGLMAVALMIPIKDLHTRQSIAAVLYMGFAIEWTLMLTALPMFAVSNYIVMLKKVAINFLRAMAFYSIILLAFAASFNTLLNKPKKDSENSTTSDLNKMEKSEESKKISIFSTIFDVVLMLTGDFEEISKQVEDSTIGRIFLLVFVLSMSIVMMNLLVGLTVSDTAAIEREAEWYKWWDRAKMLATYECMALNR